MSQHIDHMPERVDYAYYQDAVTQLIALPVDDFLNNMVELLARILNYDGVLLTQCCDIPNGQATPLAFWYDNQLTATEPFNIPEREIDVAGAAPIESEELLELSFVRGFAAQRTEVAAHQVFETLR